MRHLILACCAAAVAGTETLGTPPWVTDLEKLICAEAKKSTTEETVVKAACGEITKKIPTVPEALCEQEAKSIYEKAEQMCPPEMLGTPPWVTDLEKLICAEAKKSTTE